MGVFCEIERTIADRFVWWEGVEESKSGKIMYDLWVQQADGSAGLIYTGILNGEPAKVVLEDRMRALRSLIVAAIDEHERLRNK